MGLVLSHAQNEGANIDTRIFTKVIELIPNEKITMEIEKRDYNFAAEAPTWSTKKDKFDLSLEEEISWEKTELLEEGIAVKLFDLRYTPSINRCTGLFFYTAPKNCPLERVNYWKVASPWRPYFKSDGVAPDDFSVKPKELLFEELKGNLQLFYAWCIEPKVGGDILYYGIKKDEGFRLIARMIEGKLAPVSLPNSSKIRYDPSIKGVKDYIQRLAQDLVLLTAVRCVPTRYGPRKKRNAVFGIIAELSDSYAEGKIERADLKELVWNYR